MNSVRALLSAVLVSLSALAADAACPASVAVSMPSSGCRLGTAVASVAPVDGASYAWTVKGGTILSGNGTPRVVIGLGDGADVQASVIVLSGQCGIPGQASLTLHDVFAVKVMADAGHAGDPLTIRWSYSGGEPAAQSLTGTDFPDPIVLAPAARSYTYTPSTAGVKDTSISASATVAAAGRRRAVGGGSGGVAVASNCSAAHSTATYAVDECLKPSLRVSAPPSVLPGSTFQAQAITDPNVLVHWTIKNGTPATADGPVISIRAGDTGKVEISATAQRGGCSNLAAADAAPNIVSDLQCDNPVATVVAGPHSCGTATIYANFSGLPPYSGKWSDGETFSTREPSITRVVTAGGNYSITSFADGMCTGTSAGMVAVPQLTTAVITTTGSCEGDTATVHFTGTPPFTGQWTDLQWFETSESSIQRTVPATDNIGLPIHLDIKYFRDGADCAGQVLGGFDAHPVTRATAQAAAPFAPFADCIPYPPGPGVTPGAILAVNFDGGTLPLTVNWSDGVTSTNNAWPVYRFIDPHETTTYTVVSAHDAYCKSILAVPTATIWVSPRPEIITPDIKLDNLYGICFHTSTTAHLTSVPAGATPTWSVQNGTITGGQGTGAITFTTGENGPGSISCTFTFNDHRCPVSQSAQMMVWGIPPAPTIKITPSTIPPGGTATITYAFGLNTYVGWLNSTRQDEITAVGNTCPDNVCTSTFHDIKGVGSNTITVFARGYCSPLGQEVTASATVNIAQPPQ